MSRLVPLIFPGGLVAEGTSSPSPLHNGQPARATVVGDAERAALHLLGRRMPTVQTHIRPVPITVSGATVQMRIGYMPHYRYFWVGGLVVSSLSVECSITVTMGSSSNTAGASPGADEQGLEAQWDCIVQPGAGGALVNPGWVNLQVEWQVLSGTATNTCIAVVPLPAEEIGA